MKFVNMILVFIFLFACSQKKMDTLENIVQGKHRSSDNKKRDKYRHPVETLKFFSIKENMNVIEISPGSGWYSEIIAPFVQNNGKYTAAWFDSSSSKKWMKTVNDSLKNKFDGNKEIYGNPNYSVFAPPRITEINPKGLADMVLTFRNVHNWMKAGALKEAFQMFADALKTGGILGVVEHRENEDAIFDAKSENGYVKESTVIDAAKSVGLKLVAKSEINANPKDTKNHPKGVWTLPPSLKLKDVDREKYIEIGESDRMTLKFVKQ